MHARLLERESAGALANTRDARQVTLPFTERQNTEVSPHELFFSRFLSLLVCGNRAIDVSSLVIWVDYYFILLSFDLVYYKYFVNSFLFAV